MREAVYWRSDEGKQRRQKGREFRRRRLARVLEMREIELDPIEDVKQAQMARITTQTDALRGVPPTQQAGQVYSSVNTGPRGEYGG